MPIKTLIIDDDEVDRLAINRYLAGTSLNLQIEEASDGQSGLEKFRTNKFDCVLLDYRLPDSDGVLLLKEMVGSAEVPTAVIMLTGMGDEHVASDAIKNGAQDYLAKRSLSCAAIERAIVNAMEKVQLMRDLEQRQIDLERSNKELEQFAYMASHDLSEPLRIIRSFLQLLEKRYTEQLDDKGKEYIQFAVDAAARMQAMISSVLELSRIGRRDGELTTFDVEEAVELAKGNLRLAIDESGAEVTCDLLPRVTGSLSRITQLFQNLIGNAIKYRRDDEAPRIHIGAELVSDDAPERAAADTTVRSGPMWKFSVSDNGQGMDPEYHDRAFIMFQRLQAREENDGSGIGLSLCKKIVEIHHGRIWFESEPGQGTTMYFTLPGRRAGSAH